MKQCVRCFVILVFAHYSAASQNVGIGTTTPNASAQLDISSTSKGILIPRLTTVQRDAMVSPANGLMIYNTTQSQYNYYNGIKWQLVSGVPKNAMVLSTTLQDSSILREGFSQEGFIAQNYFKEIIADTTIPALHWYRGNRADDQNHSAPKLSCIAGFTGTQVVAFTRDSVHLYDQQSDKWMTRAITDPSIDSFAIADIIQNGTIVWTGTEFLLWGGGLRPVAPYPCGIGVCYILSVPSNRGFRYNPTMDSWSEISLVNAPQGRYNHKAIWTGTEMIVWGGKKETEDSAHFFLNTGAKYNPLTDSWTALPVSAGFEGRDRFTMTMAGPGYFMIWGGKGVMHVNRTIINPCTANPMVVTYDSTVSYANGRVYNLSNNSWTEMSTTNAPAGRYGHTAVWAGYELIVTGGQYRKPTTFYCGLCGPIIPTNPCVQSSQSDSLLRTGARYDLASNTWTAIPDCPRTLINCSTFWDDDQFISYFATDTVMSFEPSANDWFQDLYSPFVSFSNTLQRQMVWRIGSSGPPDLVALPPGYSFSNRQAIFNYRRTPTTIADLKSTVTEPGKRLYLYKKN